MVKGAAGRRPRTKEELLGLADIEGVAPVEGPSGFDQRGRLIKPKDDEGEGDKAAQAAAEEALKQKQAKDEALKQATTEPEPELLEVSMDNTKAELLEACEKMGVTPPKGATKTKLLEVMEQHGE
jgi:hypothetical protein